MNKLKKIIKEEVNKFITEYYDEEYEVQENYFEKYNETLREIFQDFLYDNDEQMTKRIPWMLVNPMQLKQIWEQFIKFKSVSNTKGLEKIAGIMYNNIIKLNVLTYLSGHTPDDPHEDFEENIGYYVDEFIQDHLKRIYNKHDIELDGSEVKYEDPNQLKLDLQENYNQEFTNTDKYLIYYVQEEIIGSEYQNNMKKVREMLFEELLNKFYDYYSTDKNGTWLLSDYGLKPLQTLALELNRTSDHNQMVVVIDKMLNVVHQRSDMAGWFVQGGSSALSDISGYISDEDAWNSKSSISGEYKPSSYYR